LVPNLAPGNKRENWLLFSSFDNLAGMACYRTPPLHKEFVKVAGPQTDDFIATVYDQS
jgi:hypothetical protein